MAAVRYRLFGLVAGRLSLGSAFDQVEAAVGRVVQEIRREPG
jgi:hypothetical protein